MEINNILCENCKKANLKITDVTLKKITDIDIKEITKDIIICIHLKCPICNNKEKYYYSLEYILDILHKYKMLNNKKEQTNNE